MKMNIFLFGIGIEAEKFYNRYKHCRNIIGAIDNYKTGYFHGLKIYKPDELKDMLEKGLIVVTSSASSYLEISKILKNIGIKENVGFVWYGNYEKKNMVMYGNCHFSTIKDYFDTVPDVVDEYNIKYFRIGDISGNQYPTREDLIDCDVFLMQDIRMNNKANVPGCDEILKMVPHSAKKIIIPNLYGCNLFFPQLVHEGNDGEVYKAHKKAVNTQDVNKNEIINAMSCYHDSVLDKLISQGFSNEEILEKILDDDIYDREEICNQFNKQIEKLRDREEKCDVHIVDYILDNYQDKLMFYEPNHPSSTLLCEIGKRILKQININGGEPVSDICGALDAREVFVYKSVKKHLNMNFKQEYIRNNATYATYNNCRMDLKRYISWYRCWMCDL